MPVTYNELGEDHSQVMNPPELYILRWSDQLAHVNQILLKQQDSRLHLHDRASSNRALSCGLHSVFVIVELSRVNVTVSAGE